MSYFIANALKTDSRDCHLTECRERERERDRERVRERKMKEREREKREGERVM